MSQAGKLPVYVKKDAPGFVGNRLLHALYREAMSIVEQGIADADTVDLVLKYGPGMRFQVMAPFEHMDMVGLDLGIAVESYLWPHLEDSHEVLPMLADKVAKGELGFKTGGSGLPHLDARGAEGLPREPAGSSGQAGGRERARPGPARAFGSIASDSCRRALAFPERGALYSAQYNPAGDGAGPIRSFDESQVVPRARS